MRETTHIKNRRGNAGSRAARAGRNDCRKESGESGMLAGGWTLDPDHGAVCRFRHIAASEAQSLAEDSRVVVVETINWTYAGGNRKLVHQNNYFAFDMRSAIALAAQTAMESYDVAEDVVAIRQAGKQELRAFLKVAEYFAAAVPDAISERKAQSLEESSQDEEQRGNIGQMKERRKRQSRPCRIISEKEFREILDKVKGEEAKDALKLLWLSGARASEIVRLRMEDVDLETGRIII